jgi:hypothetical protein
VTNKLSSIPTGKLYQAQIAALARIHLWVTGETHLLINDFARQARAILLKRAGEDGVFDGASGYQAQVEILRAWGDVQTGMLKTIQAGMKQAAWLPFALMAEEHQRRVAPLAVSIRQESTGYSTNGKNLTEAVGDGAGSTVFAGWVEQQFRVLIDQANTRIIDGLNLSGRVWKLDREAREGINNLVVQAIVKKQDAWSMAKDLEQFLGANQDCPRWTSSRLYGLTKSEIAGGDLQGLITGKSCDGQGVAYKALRLARTEIQAIHADAATRQMAASPWVQQERIVLSEGHPQADICDDVVDGGEDGKGIYDVGSISLPLHPQCLCYKVAVTISDDEFVSKMRGWMNNTQEWPEMDAYSQNVTGGVGVDLSAETVSLSIWLWGAEKVLEKVMSS